MNPFKSKEQKQEKKQDKLEELMERNNLQNLAQEDKETVESIFKSLSYTPIVGRGGNKVDDATLNMTQAIIDQNLIIIKLLSEINHKLDK